MASGFYLTVVRKPHDDENYVMTAYERHLSRCPHCAISGGLRREDHVLCDQGYRYARDVANYIFAQNEKYFSVVAIERGSRVQVKVPREAVKVRSLLAAIEDGLTLHSPNSVNSTRCNHIDHLQPNTGRSELRNQSPKLETYRIIERKPYRANSQAFRCCFLCRRPGHPPVYNTDLVGRLESQSKPRRCYRIVERFPHAKIRGALA